MGDPFSSSDIKTRDRGVNSKARSTSRAERGLEDALAEQRRRRRQQPLLDRTALEEDMRRGRAQADRRLEVEAEAAQQRRPVDDVRVTEPLRDSFGAREVGAENVPDPSLHENALETVGVPLPPAILGKEDVELKKALAEIAHLKREQPPSGKHPQNVVQLRDLWQTLPKQTRDRLLSALRSPRIRPRAQSPGQFSLDHAIRLLGQINLADLRQAGVRIHPKYGDKLTLNHQDLNTVICYVGPGVGVMFYPTGDMAEFEFGPAFDVEAMHEWAKPDGGMFFSLSGWQTVRLLYPKIEYCKTVFRVRIGGPLREWRAIKSFTRNRAILFIVSPSYFKRRSFKQAFTGLPDRAWRAASRAIDKDYVLYAAGDQAEQIQNMDLGDIAGQIVDLAIDIISPIPTYEDLKDAKRIGRATIMAMWGASGEPYVNSDIDIAARLYAREMAAQVLGLAFKAAHAVAKTVGGSLGKGYTPKQVDVQARERATVDSPEADVRSTLAAQVQSTSAGQIRPSARGDYDTRASHGERDLSPKAHARPARPAEQELREGSRRLVNDETPPSERAMADPIKPDDRGTNETNTNRPVRPRREAPPGGRPRNSALDKDTLDNARDQLEAAEYYWAQLPENNQKTVAHSDGQYTQSGYGYSKRSREFPQRKAPEGESESAYYVRQYEELSGRKPPPGNDNDIKGDEFAAHAEVKDRIHQSVEGKNSPTGVSSDMCRNCRLWHRDTARKQGEQIVVTDPSYTRAFNPDGTVDIYLPDDVFVRTIPSSVEPAAGVRKNYEGVEW